MGDLGTSVAAAVLTILVFAGLAEPADSAVAAAASILYSTLFKFAPAIPCMTAAALAAGSR